MAVFLESLGDSQLVAEYDDGVVLLVVGLEGLHHIGSMEELPVISILGELGPALDRNQSAVHVQSQDLLLGNSLVALGVAHQDGALVFPVDTTDTLHI